METTDRFFQYLSRQSREIVYLSAGPENGRTSLVNTNALLNQARPDDWGLIELIVKTESQNREKLYAWMEVLVTFFSFDYGYGFDLQKKQDLFSEITDNRSLWDKILHRRINHLAEMKRRKEELLQVKEGKIPRIYEVNIWNDQQLEQARKENFPMGDLRKLSDNLSLAEWTDRTTA